MEWIIIALVLLAAFGPVLWLVPSRRDRQLAAMRARARQHGLVVEMTSIADPDPTPQARVSAGGKRRQPLIAGASYQLNLPRAALLAPSFVLLRGDGDDPSPVIGWQTIGQAPAIGDGWERFAIQLAPILERLPADVLTCSGNARCVACFWRERVGNAEAETVVDALAKSLQELADLQRAHDAATEQQRERERLLEARDGADSTPPSS